MCTLQILDAEILPESDKNHKFTLSKEDCRTTVGFECAEKRDRVVIQVLHSGSVCLDGAIKGGKLRTHKKGFLNVPMVITAGLSLILGMIEGIVVEINWFLGVNLLLATIFVVISIALLVTLTLTRHKDI